MLLSVKVFRAFRILISQEQTKSVNNIDTDNVTISTSSRFKSDLMIHDLHEFLLIK